jgi:hypothetical protein
MSNTDWEMLQFPVQATEAFARFERQIIRPMDCVINALQILGIVQQQSADIMRILVNDTGVTAEQLELIFDTLYPGREHHFQPMNATNFVKNLSRMKYDQSPSIIFAGVTYKSGGKHAFLIERSSMGGHFKVIDAQRGSIIHCGDKPADVIHTYLPDYTTLYVLQERIKRPSVLKRSRSPALRIRRARSRSRSPKRIRNV